MLVCNSNLSFLIPVLFFIFYFLLFYFNVSLMCLFAYFNAIKYKSQFSDVPRFKPWLHLGLRYELVRLV